jgi:hypothetical protein
MVVENVLIRIMVVVLAVTNAIEILLMNVVVTIVMMMVLVTVMVRLEKKLLGFFRLIERYVDEYWLSVSRPRRYSSCI